MSESRYRKNIAKRWDFMISKIKFDDGQEFSIEISKIANEYGWSVYRHCIWAVNSRTQHKIAEGTSPNLTVANICANSRMMQYMATQS